MVEEAGIIKPVFQSMNLFYKNKASVIPEKKLKLNYRLETLLRMESDLIIQPSFSSQ